MKTLFAPFALAALLANAPQAQAQGSDLHHFSPGMHFDEKDGESLYRNICQGCHMPDGQGASGAGRYPALAGNPRLAAKAYPVFMVTHGQRAMPGFGEQLDDAQIAEVVNYVRTHLGNGYTDAVTPAEVKAARK